MFATDDTIVAVASAVGGADRSVVRLSGPKALTCTSDFFLAGDAPNSWPPSVPTRVDGKLRLSEFREMIRCAALVWPSARSYTRAPTVELHVPGAPPIVEATAAAACRYGARPARPGEFTLRAFLAGRIDLAQAEAVLGVVDAADRRRLETALRQMAGGLSGPLTRLRDQLLDLIAELEAGLDFVEEDVRFIERDAVIARLADASSIFKSVVERMSARQETGESVRIVLVGLPNVGKSSLFNALCGGEAAIVSPLAGTTRDYLAARITFGGIECELIDTAGADPFAASPLAQAAQAATRDGERRADVRILCVDSSRRPTDWERARCAELGEADVVVRTKADLPAGEESMEGLGVSTVDGTGLDALRARLSRIVAEAAGGGDVVASTAARCGDGVRRAGDALDDARRAANAGLGDELVAASLRTALDELGQVVGAVYTDDILDRIFSRFCIGK